MKLLRWLLLLLRWLLLRTLIRRSRRLQLELHSRRSVAGLDERSATGYCWRLDQSRGRKLELCVRRSQG